MNRCRINMFSIFLITIFLYPILPQYVYLVDGVNLVNMLLAISIAIFLFIHGKIAKIRLNNNIIIFWIFHMFMALRYGMGAGFLSMITYVLSFIILPWFLITFCDTEEKFIKVIDTLIIGGVFLGIIGLIESVLKFNVIQVFANEEVIFFHEIRYGLLRIMTTFGQPIAYGIYQVFIIVLINYRMSFGDSKKYLKLCYVISALNIFLSVSRTPIIAFVLIQIILLYRKSKKRFINYLLLAIVAILASGIVFSSLNVRIPLVSDLLQTIDLLLSGTTTSNSTTVGVGNRLDLWLWVYLSMGDNWIWGNGIGTQFAYQVYEWQTKTSIENQYLFILWHCGLVGMMLLIFSYISILHYTWKRRFNSLLKYVEGISFNSVIFILMLVYYVVELGIQETDISRIYGIFIALVIAYNRIIEKRDHRHIFRIHRI